MNTGDIIGLLDLGNSRYKWTTTAALDAGRVQRLPYAAEAPCEAIAQALRDEQVDRWIVASVKGADFDCCLTDALRRGGIGPVGFLRIPACPPFELAYTVPQQFGIDRYLDLLGARAHHPLPCIVIDAGTAVTFDALDANGDHLGGCIFPGLHMLRQALGRGTRLISINPAAEAELWARSTQAGVNGGTLFGLRDACRGLIARMRDQLGAPATAIWTGGDADLLRDASDTSSRIDSLLLFRGIRASLPAPCQ